MSAGCRLASSIASAFANRHTSFCTGPRTIGTYTCSPREPVVLTSDGIRSASSASRTTKPVSRTRAERRALAGIEVEVQIVGPIDVVAARIPLVQVDAPEVDDPEQRREVLHDRESR